MLGQFEAALAQHLSAVDDRVHQNILARRELANLIPAKDPVLRQNTFVANRVVGVVENVLIDIVAHEQINRLIHLGELPQRSHYFLQRITVQPVIGVHDLEIHTGRIAHALIDSLTVAAVFLMDDPHDGGIFFGVGIGNLAGFIGGAVIHQNDFRFFPGREKRFNAVAHIGGGVVAGYGKCNQFHILSSILF